MGTPITLSDELICSVAEKIAAARRMHGADSTYVIGLFAGLDWLFEGGDADGVHRRLRDRVLEIEGATEPMATLPDAVVAAPESSPVTDGGLADNVWVKGAVKWFNNDKGYGFISTESDTDVFVHWRDISSWDRSLGQGDEVEFMVTKTAKGYQAVNVMKSDKPAAEDVDGEPVAHTDEVKGGEAAAEESAETVTAENDAEAGEPAAETPMSVDQTALDGTRNDGDSPSAIEAPEGGDSPGAMESAESTVADHETMSTSEPQAQGEEAAPAPPATDPVENHVSDQDSAQTD